MSNSSQIMQPVGWGLRAMRPQDFVSRFLSDDGTDGGTGGANATDASVNGSVTPVKYWAAFDRIAYINRVIVYIKDTGALAADKYGNIAVLTNGIAVQVTELDGTTVLAEFSGGRDPRSVSEWTALCYDGTNHSFGSGDNAFAVRWTFERFGGPIQLDVGQRFQVVISDDLSGLTGHSFHLSGTFE